MTDDRVVTAKVPAQIANRLDEVSQRLDRSRSWVIREALMQWLAEEDRRHILTREAMEDVASVEPSHRKKLELGPRIESSKELAPRIDPLQ